MTNIIIISYYNIDCINGCIESIHNNTNEKTNIIVGDNYSENSNEIRKLLKEKLIQKKINKCYFYDNNYGTNILNHIIINEKFNKNLNDYTIISDGDIQIIENENYFLDNNCWLKDYKEIISKENIGILAFSSKNYSYSEKNKRMSIIKNFNSNNKFNKNEDTINAHLMCIKNDILNGFLKKSIKAITDGGIIFYAQKNFNYKIYRYDRRSVINLSTIKCGGKNISNLNLSENNNYKIIRKNKMKKLGNFQKIKKFKIITKKDL